MMPQKHLLKCRSSWISRKTMKSSVKRLPKRFTEVQLHTELRLSLRCYAKIWANTQMGHKWRRLQTIWISLRLLSKRRRKQIEVKLVRNREMRKLNWKELLVKHMIETIMLQCCRTILAVKIMGIMEMKKAVSWEKERPNTILCETFEDVENITFWFWRNENFNLCVFKKQCLMNKND